jgi:hypothetical protein
MYYYLIEIATISTLVSIFYKCYKKENKRFNKKRKKNNLNYMQQDYITNKTKIDYSKSIHELV